MARGSIEKRGRSYRATYPGPDGKKVQQTFPKKSDAQRWLTNQLSALDRGDWVNPTAGKITFQEYALEWLDKQPHRVNTAASTASRLRNHVFPAFGDYPIAAVLPSDVQALVGSLTRVRRLAPATVEVTYRHIASVFRSAVNDQIITRSPCRGIQLPRPEGKKVHPISVDQVGAMADHVPARLRAAVVTGAGLGLRQGELFGLTVDRVDFLRRTVRIDRQLVTATGQAPELATVKTPSSVRDIPLPDVVAEALSEHLRVFGAGPDALIFTAESGVPLRRNRVADSWRKAAAAVGFPTLTGWHELRHHYASLLIQAGESVKVVQARLGHKSATETLDTYGHLWPDSEEATRLAVDRQLGARLSARSLSVAADGTPLGMPADGTPESHPHSVPIGALRTIK